VQIVAPRSIIAWAKSPARASGVIRPAAAWIAALPPGSGAPIANSRATTRSTLASTTTARRPKAIAATEAAVYWPSPGRARRPSSVSGKAPPRAATARAQASRLRARA